MNAFKLLFVLVALFFFGCGGTNHPHFFSLLEAQPSATSVSPEPETALTDPIAWTVQFSQRIDLQDLSEQAIVLRPGNLDAALKSDWSELKKTLEDEKESLLPLHFILSEDERQVIVEPEDALSPGEYDLIITPALVSVTGIPFNQSPGGSPLPFVGHYRYGEAAAIPNNDGDSSTVSFGPSPEFLRINEFLYDGLTSETDGECFIELYGTPDADISLFQILLINGADGKIFDQITLPPQSLIRQDGVFLIADLKTNSKTLSQIAEPDFLDQFDPQNGPDAVQLLNRQGNLLDSLAYGQGVVGEAANGLETGEGSPAPDVAPGHSLNRRQGEDQQDNEQDFMDMATPSPGRL